MTIRWIKCCDDFWPQIQIIDQAIEASGHTPTKRISHCPWCGRPIAVEGEPDPRDEVLKILAPEPTVH